jgi:choline kinase
MPPRANLCSMLVEMKRAMDVSRDDEHMSKSDVCDVAILRISQITQQLISAPYCNNFCFEIDKPPELDNFDRAALHHMEQSDSVAE